MENRFVSQNRMLPDPVQERAQHPRPLDDHRRILLCFTLLDGVLGYGRLGGHRRDDQRRIEFRQGESKSLKLGIPAAGFDGLGGNGRQRCENKTRAKEGRRETYICADHIDDVR